MATPAGPRHSHGAAALHGRALCGGAGLGGVPYRDGSFEYYITEKIIPNDPKGVGPFIFAALEMERAGVNEELAE